MRASGADVVVLAEVYAAWNKALTGLADLYPHRVDCLSSAGCDVVILAKRPPLASHAYRDPRSNVPLVEARVALGGRELTDRRHPLGAADRATAR